MSKLIELAEEYGAALVAAEDCRADGKMYAAKRQDADSIRILSELRTRLESLERIEAAARVYATRYVQDEADDPEVCVCPGQHEHAKELIEALSVIEPIRGSWHFDAAMGAAK